MEFHNWSPKIVHRYSKWCMHTSLPTWKQGNSPLVKKPKVRTKDMHNQNLSFGEHAARASHACVSPSRQNSWIVREYAFLAIATSSLFLSLFKVCCSTDRSCWGIGRIESLQVGNGFNCRWLATDGIKKMRIILLSAGHLATYYA
jgi:hypothetical protein